MTEPTADGRAELAEALHAAEAAEAEALAEAARATARAEQLREAARPLSRPARRWPVRRGLAVALAGVLAGAGVALVALMLWQHQRVAAQQARDAEFVEAARAGVVALLSIDHRRAKDDVQRVLDLSTGAFRDDFESRADDFVSTAEKSDAVTKGSISAAALEWAQADKGVVLVAASSQVTNSSGARDDPRPWRMSVTLTRDGGQVKMSDVEFVP
jgi:Mce-associated membrane protein